MYGSSATKLCGYLQVFPAASTDRDPNGMIIDDLKLSSDFEHTHPETDGTQVVGKPCRSHGWGRFPVPAKSSTWHKVIHQVLPCPAVALLFPLVLFAKVLNGDKTVSPSRPQGPQKNLNHFAQSVSPSPHRLP